MMWDNNLKKNILVVDDSALMRRVICDIINSDKTFRATDVCRDGLEAYEQIRKGKYDAVILDVNMPRMDGLQLLEKLQQDNIKATVIMVSTLTAKDTKTTLMAMERGAVDFVTKPTNIIEAKGEAFREHLLGVLDAVISARREQKSMPVRTVRAPLPSVQPVKKRVTGKKLVALACSTGGPKSLQSVIPYLDAALDAPMVLVQHMPAGFTKSMADRLDTLSEVSVKEAEEGDVLKAGCVYVARGGKHLNVITERGSSFIHYSDEPNREGVKPCANYMYESLAKSSYDQIVCVVMTGMGADGTVGVTNLKKDKKIHVIAQQEDSCAVYGMPKNIVKAGLADQIVDLDDIAQEIIMNVGVK